jgi:hypothetical protein
VIASCHSPESFRPLPNAPLSELVLRLNAGAKSAVLSIQEYFTLAWNSLRFIFARPFYT